MTDQARLSVDPDACFARVDGVMVTWIPTRREFFALTPLAEEFLGELEGAGPDLPAALVDDLGRQLRDIGVLADPKSAESGRHEIPAPPLAPDPLQSDHPASRPAATSEPVGSPPPSASPADLLGPYAAAGHHFTVAVGHDRLASEVRRVLGDLQVEEVRQPLLTYRIAADGTALWAGPERLEAHPSLAGVLATLLWDVNRRAVDATTEALVLHAGAVVGRDGRAIVLPAAMEAGKSTLVTGLLGAGLGYLSDELAIIDERNRTVRPHPKALSLDPGSWPLFPQLEPPPEQRELSPNPGLLTADQVRAGSRHPDPAPLGHLVFPHHDPSGPTQSRALDPLECLRHLAESAFGFRERPEEVLPRLAGLAESTPAFQLRVGPGIDDAVAVVTGLAQPTTAPS